MMKVFVLINEQDTDASNQSTVQLFLDKEAARAEMRKQFKAELPSWNVDAENLTDDQECECGEDTAVIRNDPDSTNWRIEEKELDVQVAVRVAGGLVQEVHSNADVGVDVYDLDVSDFPDKGEQEAADQKEAELDELVKSPGWRVVW